MQNSFATYGCFHPCYILLLIIPYELRNTRSLDMVLADLTNTVKLDTGAVRKIYTLDGHPVNSLIDLKVGTYTEQ